MTGDEKSITRAKGIGAKSAKRIILELKEKIGGALDFSQGQSGAGVGIPAQADNEGADGT